MTRTDDPEDVLSSIRRLVAGEIEEGAVEDQPDAKPPILLLGPAVRVTEPEDAFQMIHRRASERRSERPQGGMAEVARTGGSDAALRALVAEVVREELAGELGQRITRNLRQLVLRELRAAGGSGGSTRTVPGPEA